MSLPFYVAPEQQMKDRADFARKGIARGRSVVALRFRDGVVMVAENPSGTLHKISEIYDRIAFAAVGKYNEFERLRVAGVRFADLTGFSYDYSLAASAEDQQAALYVAATRLARAFGVDEPQWFRAPVDAAPLEGRTPVSPGA